MPLHPMTLRSFQIAAALAVLALPAFLSAQEISANEEERLEALARANAEVYTPKSNVTVGFRVLSSGAKIRFGNLGIVPTKTKVAPATDGAALRVYDNGFVNVDAARAEETAATTTTLPGGRYQTSVNLTGPGADGVLGTGDDVTTNSVTGNLLSYAAGLTRIWSYSTPQQATTKPEYIAMSSYSATSDGGFMEKKQGVSGGVELQYARSFGKLSKRTEWSLNTGISLNDINSKARGSVLSTLRSATDFYSLNGLPAPATSPGLPYTAPKSGDLTDSNGVILIINGLETTTPLSAAPSTPLSTTKSIVGGTSVRGNWQVKGGYFMVKLGPAVRTQLTERLGLTASLGLAGAYAGTHYSAVESFDVPDVGTTISTTEVSDASKFVAGYYADLNVEWAANERTGLFGGLTAQKFDGYDQFVGGRSARIDLGSSVGIRGGFSIRF